MLRVLGFGTYNKRKHPRVGILLSGLAKRGCEVEEINHVLDLSTSQRVEILKKPWKLFGFAATILRLWSALREDARRWMSENGKPDAVIVGYMGHFDVLLARRVFKDVPIVLDHLIFAGDTARDRGAKGLKVRLLNVLDSLALRSADLILLDTEEHRAMLPPEMLDKSMVVPVGASDEWHEAGAGCPMGERKRGAVFYGLYTPLQGAPVIARAIKELSRRGRDYPFTMIGTGQDYDEVREMLADVDTVEFIDWVEPEDLPCAVSSHAVSLGIFSTTPKGLRVVPNKVYQALASQCAVITSDTAPQRRMLGDAVLFVEPGDYLALADALEKVLSDGALLARYQQRSAQASECFSDTAITADLFEWISRHVPEAG